MNAAGSVTAMSDVRALAQSRSGAVVHYTTTVHPFVHPQFRSLQNPGTDKLAPLARELAASGSPPVVASIAGAPSRSSRSWRAPSRGPAWRPWS